MRVTFVLPGAARVPTGGARVVFRYANALAGAGWSVKIVMPADLKGDGGWRRAARVGRFWLWRWSGGFAPGDWFALASGVKLSWVRDLRDAPAGDVVVATAVQTAEAVAAWPASAGRKFYFVQGYETWDFPAERVHASWRLPFTKLAVSRWLCELIAAAGAEAVYLPNGVDEKTFGLDRPVEARREAVVVWPHHAAPQKGSQDALEALAGLVAVTPRLEVHAFGVGRAPRAGGVRVRYHRNPSQAALRALYNRATVAIAPSHAEGWGLPACEALQCGCALAASDIGGHREFLRHESNALLHPPGDAGALRENVRRLLNDESLRQRLARQGAADMAELRFDVAAERLQRVFSGKGRK